MSYILENNLKGESDALNDKKTKLFLENGYVSLNKAGEELCGDKVECIKSLGYTTLVLADGLGSGVKANILATLTSKILSTMISSDIPLEDCIETIIGSLPICKVRNVAYATFSLIHVNKFGEGFLVEFDNPFAFFIRDNKELALNRERLNILGKIVYKTPLKLQKNDVIIMISDGVIHAGVGKLLNFGWSRENVSHYLCENYSSTMSARAISAVLAAACKDLYLDSPGDDTTVAAIKIRETTNVKIMVGPPIDKSQDDYAISTFLEGDGKKIVCGGTSSQIVAKYLKKEVTTSLDYLDKDVPPIGHIDGIDLTTEGVLTLRKLLELCDTYLSTKDVSPKYFTKKDGASLLADLLFEKGTSITFYVGRSVNLAHQGLPIDTTMKLKLVERLALSLETMGKNVEVYYF